MGPTHHLDGEEEEEDGNASSVGREGALSEPSTGDCSEDALVNNMKRLNIEREEMRRKNEDEDDECLLQTLTIQVSYEEAG